MRTYPSKLDSTSPLSVFFPNSDAHEPVRSTMDRLISPPRGIVAVGYDLMVWETGCVVQENRCKSECVRVCVRVSVRKKAVKRENCVRSRDT